MQFTRSRVVLVASVLAMLTAVACRRYTYQVYEFEPVQGVLPNGLPFSFIAVGRSVPMDSAGQLIDRTGSPYRIVLYVDDQRGDSLVLTGVKLTRPAKGDSILLPMSPLRRMNDTTSTLVSGVQEMELAHEDYLVTIYVAFAEGGGVHSDSTQVMMKKTYSERSVPLTEQFQRF